MKDIFIYLLGFIIVPVGILKILDLLLGDENIPAVLAAVIVFGSWAITVWYYMDQQKQSETSTKSQIIDEVSDSWYPDNWNEIRQKALIRDGYQCGNCGGSRNLHVHHIVPISKGGSHQLSNLRTLCENCHRKIHPHMEL